LRTLDALQLASAMVLATPAMTFVTADRALAEIARLEGLATYDPNTG
jgi:predicted nucleic acid-binding protein